MQYGRPLDREHTISERCGVHLTVPSRRLEHYMLGDSPAMVALRRLVLRLAPTKLSVVIEGPTGAGKELVAQSLHRYGARSGQLVALNACAISESMFESEMFGHRRGAFTGAVADKPGLLTLADGGTIFLDEIGGLGLASQVKLLRAVETGEVRAVGGTAVESSDFRAVSATNVPLAQLVASGQFRADLAHRLGVAVINVPSLEQRREDIPALALHFAGERRPLRPSAIRALARMDWPGNVRDLRNVVRLAVELSDGPVTGRFVAELARERCRPRTSIGPMSKAHERLLAALRANGWGKRGAAADLGVHVATVYRQMRRLGLSGPT